MDFGRSFTFMTEDPQWINKLLIAGVMLLAGVLLSFIIVGIVPLLIFAGYMVELLQNTASGNPQPLPEWNDFGTKLMKGLHVAAIGIVYALPLILFACCQFVLGIAIGGAKGGTNAQPNETLATLSTLVGLCFGCFAAVYGIVLAVVTPAAITQYAVTAQLPAAFRFSEVIAYIRNNASNYIWHHRVRDRPVCHRPVGAIRAVSLVRRGVSPLGRRRPARNQRLPAARAGHVNKYIRAMLTSIALIFLRA
ncbi:MAG: DUF4013 domain-containing protein [Chloroflexi bacterium]|nr:MAG: DUF4013 domain-containing protein [Chloroflexota bacterium]